MRGGGAVRFRPIQPVGAVHLWLSLCLKRVTYMAILETTLLPVCFKLTIGMHLKKKKKNFRPKLGLQPPTPPSPRSQPPVPDYQPPVPASSQLPVLASHLSHLYQPHHSHLPIPSSQQPVPCSLITCSVALITKFEWVYHCWQHHCEYQCQTLNTECKLAEISVLGMNALTSYP